MKAAAETPRLLIRRFLKSDLGDFYAYARDPHVGPNAGWKPHGDINESKRILKRFVKNRNIFALCDRATGKVIGSVGFHDDDKRPYIHSLMLGYVLSYEYWGRGLMCEAVASMLHYPFTELGAEIVSVYHYPENIRSKRVIEKSGFSYEGTLRFSSLSYNGKPVDNVCYSMTRKEFFMMHPEYEDEKRFLNCGKTEDIKKFTHVIWDYNGTLADDRNISLTAVNMMLEKRGRAPLSPDDYLNSVTSPLSEFYRQHFGFENESYHALIMEFHATYDTMLSGLKPALDAEATMRKLHESGIRQAVLSAYEHGKLLRDIERCGLMPYADDICGAADFEAGSKLEQGRALLCKLGADPRKTLFVGDTVHDHDLAKALGADCILICRGHQSRDVLRSCGAEVGEDFSAVLRKVLLR